MMVFLIISAIVLSFFLSVIVYTKQKKFGKNPHGERLIAVKNSPNYINGKFINLEYTPDLTEGVSFTKVLREFLFVKNPRRKPARPLPAVKENLRSLLPDKNCIVWFGHSSYFIQTNHKTILVDPVFSGAASPLKFTTRAFSGSDVYSPEDFPEIDFLFITHDHWDHLDFETILKLKPKVKKIITSLGTGEHFSYWGFDKSIIYEMDWNEFVDLDNGFTVHSCTARHFSGRAFKRAQTLWSSFVLTTPDKKFYLGGDSGYGKHFKDIGDKFGPFDLALLECGQYNKNWKYIHMMPEELVEASRDLKAKNVLPLHWAKFALAMHDWDEPILRVMKAAQDYQLSVMTPLIGQVVDLDKKKHLKSGGNGFSSSILLHLLLTTWQ